jgi:hypothetical protein
MVLNATFNTNSIISWRSVLLVEETRVHGENYRPAANHIMLCCGFANPVNGEVYSIQHYVICGRSVVFSVY